MPTQRDREPRGPSLGRAARWRVTTATAAVLVGAGLPACGAGSDDAACEVGVDPGCEPVRACLPACGPDAADDCCASALVEGNAAGATREGETFYRSYDASGDPSPYGWAGMTAPATVSDFRLDVYEVTVARFRAFVEAGYGTQARPPAAGSGAHATLPGSGWDPAWDDLLAPDTESLMANLHCNPVIHTWTDAPGDGEFRPVDCVDWYTAQAFCVWDGGYLPTEAEWNYAAAGGSEQRAYPWSVPPDSTTIDETFASYYVDATRQCRGDGVDGCTVADLVRPGSKPAGDGRWGHADLAGNLFEWTLDASQADGDSSTPYKTPCDDCAELLPGNQRWFRGGYFNYDAADLRVASRYTGNAGTNNYLGFRCARSP